MGWFEDAEKFVRDVVEEVNDFLGRGPEGPLHPVDEDQDEEESSNADDQTVEQALVVDKELLLTPAQETAQRIQDAWDEHREASSPTTVVLTPAQEAAQRVKDAWNEGHTTTREDLIERAVERMELHEKLGSELGQGPGGHGPHKDSGDAFTDLIRVAQTPAELGLVAKQPALPESDAMLQLAAKGDFAGQDLGSHGDLHVNAASPVADSYAGVEHHVFDAPVFEQIQVGHH
jgi:hypothetical protein